MREHFIKACCCEEGKRCMVFKMFVNLKSVVKLLFDAIKSPESFGV